MATRQYITPQKARNIAEALENGMDYSLIARREKVSAATIGRLKGAMEGKHIKDNNRIYNMLKQSGWVSKESAVAVANETPEKDTQCPADSTGLTAMLDTLQSDLANLQAKINLIRAKL